MACFLSRVPILFPNQDKKVKAPNIALGAFVLALSGLGQKGYCPLALTLSHPSIPYFHAITQTWR